MKILFSFDYEIFFKENSIYSSRILIDNTNSIQAILDARNIKSTYFVDAGYIYALERQKHNYFNLEQDYKELTKQLLDLEQSGNEIGFHVHPHWEDSFFEQGNWNMNLNRFKISDFTKIESDKFLMNYFQSLNKVLKKPIISYRAGGWCLPPFHQISDVFKKLGIQIDTTVFREGYCSSKTHYYNFRDYPNKYYWRFDSDPSLEKLDGYFLEVPSTPFLISRYQYWKMLMNKFSRNKNLLAGRGVSPNYFDAIRFLLFGNIIPVSTDDNKSSKMIWELKKHEKIGSPYFVILGHPKLMSAPSLVDLKHFVDYALDNGHEFTTYADEFKEKLTPVKK